VSTLIAIVAVIFWASIIVTIVRRGLRSLTRPPLDDPNNPPDIGLFAPPTAQTRATDSQPEAIKGEST
jgi:hypothetical protein